MQVACSIRTGRSGRTLGSVAVHTRWSGQPASGALPGNHPRRSRPWLGWPRLVLALSITAVAVGLTGDGPDPRAPQRARLRADHRRADRRGHLRAHAQPAVGRPLRPAAGPERLSLGADDVHRVRRQPALQRGPYLGLAGGGPAGLRRSRLSVRAAETRLDKLLVRVAALTVAVLFLPTVAFVDQFPVPNPWGSCGTDCPPNALNITSEPGFIDRFVTPLTADHHRAGVRGRGAGTGAPPRAGHTADARGPAAGGGGGHRANGGGGGLRRGPAPLT